MRGLVVPPRVADLELRFEPTWQSLTFGLLQPR
jgi:hypothetical protein